MQSSFSNLHALRKAIESARKITSQEDWERSHDACMAITESWEHCGIAASRLFMIIGTQSSIDVTCEMLEGFLPHFELMHPDDLIPRRVLMHVRRSLSEKTSSLCEIVGLPDHPTPGANNFTNAIEQVVQALLYQDDSSKCSSFCVDAIYNVIRAWSLYTWGMDHPESWQQMYAKWCGAAIEWLQHSELLAHWAQYPMSIISEYKQWDLLADKIQQHISEDSPAFEPS